MARYIAQTAFLLFISGISFTSAHSAIRGFHELAWAGVRHNGELDCDVDNACCWQNGAPDSDRLDFAIASGAVPRELLVKHFATDYAPFGKFFVAAAAARENPAMDAQLISCGIVCTNEQVMVTFNHWTTEGVQLHVCVRESFFDHLRENQPVSCREVRAANPGPSSVMLPPGAAFEIVIMASAFDGQYGGVALVDDIRVDFVPCPDEAVIVTTTTAAAKTVATTASTTTEKPEAEACEKIRRGQNDPELWTPGERDVEGLVGLSTHFEVASGSFGPKVTGTKEPGKGNFYLATLMGLGDKAALVIDVAELKQNLVMRALRFVATQGMKMRGCCDDMNNCPLETADQVTIADKQWVVNSFLCPNGTQKFVFACQQGKPNQGVCGIDDIQLYYPDALNPQDADAATEPVCADDDE